MSYLSLPRLVFAGHFQADVNTINNVASNYATASEDPVLELWNPEGTGAFQLLDCRVTGAFGRDGPAAADDAVRRMTLAGAADRSSAKLVDLDPDFQGGSEIWGLRLRLVDLETAEPAFAGVYAVAAFRDLFTRQLFNGASNGQPAGGAFVSAVESVSWGGLAAASPFLQELAAVTEDDALSIVFNTFGFFYSHEGGRFSTGRLIGCLGPRQRGEPKTFVAGRRLVPLVVQGQNGRPVILINAANAKSDEAAGTASIDLGNSLPIDDVQGTPSDLFARVPFLNEAQALVLGVLPGESVTTGTTLAAGEFAELGVIDCRRAGWFEETGGVESFKPDLSILRSAGERPMALAARMADGSHLILNRETQDGVFVRADRFVNRLDPGKSGSVAFYATRYGRPLAEASVHIAFAPSSGQPTSALRFTSPIRTDAQGKAELAFEAGPPGNPRGPLDGQIYGLLYSPRLAPSGLPDYRGTGLNPVADRVVVHVRDAYNVPEVPEWYRDIEPIFAVYARLYPIMQRHLVDLGDYDAVVRARQALLFAFTREVEAPTYMPVTRDLARTKLEALIKWLSNETGDASEPLVKGTPPARPSALAVPVAAGVGAPAPAMEDAKAEAARTAAIAFAADLDPTFLLRL